MAAQLMRPSTLGTSTLAGARARFQSSPFVKPLSATSRFAPSVLRLVVLIPDADTDEAGLAAHLWTMASARQLAVMLLGICGDAGREPRARRRLATLAALIRDDTVHVESRLEVDTDWIHALRTVRRTTDLIVCHAEQRVARWGIRREPLSQLLLNKFNEPVCVVAGFYPDLPPDHSSLPSQALSLAVPILIVAAFTALEVLIHRTTQAAAYTFLMSTAIVVEYGLIGTWFYLFN